MIKFLKNRTHPEKYPSRPALAPRAKNTRIRLIAGALVMLTLALGFNALLTLASLEKMYVASMVSKYNVIGKDLQRNLEHALRFGKSVKNFIGIEKLLEETRRNLAGKIGNNGDTGASVLKTASEADIAVSLALPDGSILYSTHERLRHAMLPEPAQKNYGDISDNEAPSLESNYVKYEKEYIIGLPVRSGFKKTWTATAIITFSEKQIRDLLHSVLIRNMKMIGIVLLGGMALLIILLNIAIPEKAEHRKFPKFKISAILFTVIVCSQLIFTGLNTYAFKNYYLNISKEKTAVLGTLLKQDIEYLIGKGVKIDRLSGMDAMLREIISAAPELDNITITNDKNHPLYQATRTGVIDFQKLTGNAREQALMQRMAAAPDPQYQLHLELLKNEKVEGYLSTKNRQGTILTQLSKKVLFAKLKSIALDSATVLAISIFFFVELLILELQLLEKQITSIKKDSAGINFLAMRPLAFMFIFGIDICISFLPLHMQNLYDPNHPILGLSGNIVMGLPISMQMFFTSISLLIAGAWCDRRGWHEPFIIGLSLSAAGFVYAWLAPNALHFIFSLGLVGMGYGLALMASQGFIITHTTPENKAQGMAQLFAGVYAGSICGGAAGAMLADRLGYAPVFLIGGAILFSVMTYTLLTMRQAMQKPVFHAAAPEASFKISYIFQFLFDRKIFTLILLYGLPWYIVLVGFLNYFSPIYLKGIGTSQSDIGRIFMIYGICLMYIAPIISKYVGGSENKKLYLVISSFLGGLAIVNFYFLKGTSGVAATSISILLLGISACFIPVRNAYVLNLEITRKLGSGKALGIHNSVLRLGQVCGPLLFGVLFVASGSDQGIALAGIISLLLTLIYVLAG